MAYFHIYGNISVYMEIKKGLKKVLFSTPILKVLDFLLLNPDQEFSDTDISRAKVGAKRSSINAALRTLAGTGLVERTKRGSISINRLVQTISIVPHLKIISNLLEIEPFVEKCKAHSYKIILFESRADGMHGHDSDFDILFVANEPENIRNKIRTTALPLQIIIKSPEEMMRLHEAEPSLSDAISKGIVLWEKI